MRIEKVFLPFLRNDRAYLPLHRHYSIAVQYCRHNARAAKNISKMTPLAAGSLCACCNTVNFILQMRTHLPPNSSECLVPVKRAVGNG
jgi:hypothetical protein